VTATDQSCVDLHSAPLPAGSTTLAFAVLPRHHAAGNVNAATFARRPLPAGPSGIRS
jgi:hypothetical protein